MLKAKFIIWNPYLAYTVAALTLKIAGPSCFSCLLVLKKVIFDVQALVTEAQWNVNLGQSSPA